MVAVLVGDPCWLRPGGGDEAVVVVVVVVVTRQFAVRVRHREPVRIRLLSMS